MHFASLSDILPFLAATIHVALGVFVHATSSSNQPFISQQQISISAHISPLLPLLPGPLGR